MELVAEKGEQGGVAAVAGAAGPESGLAALVDELAHGVLLTTFDARLLHANQVARHELVRGGAIGLWDGGFVQACRAESDRELQSALARSAHGKRSLVHLESMEGAPLPVAVVPIKPVPGDPARCAILFSRRTVCDALMLGFFARRHGLTPTEEQVLAVLCEGLSAPQAALRMNVAVSTIRSHVRSICAKTRASGVREIVRRVAVLPPVAPAFPHQAVH
ncbi:helix-turn-helix transcriptional regulator [Ramlibacter sp. PS4R-6]|uniref:helix-turn-helix transcriptional regulator n=1 Tax=Ramlibacter sp. PS4R-6 TaxID=3133438 RepID=UPI0030A2EA16